MKNFKLSVKSSITRGSSIHGTWTEKFNTDKGSFTQSDLVKGIDDIKNILFYSYTSKNEFIEKCYKAELGDVVEVRTNGNTYLVAEVM